MFQEPPVGFHGGEQFGFFADLNVGVPSVADHPSGQELVVTRVQVILAHPEIMGESVDKFRILEDDRSVSSSSSRKTRNSSIDMRRTRNLNIPDGQPESGQDLPHRHPIPTRLDPLTRPHPAYLLILETREDVGKQRRRPNRIIISKDDDIRGSMPDSVDHLKTLVGERDGENSDLVRIDRVGKFLQGTLHGLFSDDDDLLGITFQPGKGGLCERKTLQFTSSSARASRLLQTLKPRTHLGTLHPHRW